mmetsp:Transcript_48728/g.99524  ORF Transcript_48728/g.99524 Transcript_48728/m.99524 type:complete len:210 (-) Transcript_48728:366-995(-)
MLRSMRPTVCTVDTASAAGSTMPIFVLGMGGGAFCAACCHILRTSDTLAEVVSMAAGSAGALGLSGVSRGAAFLLFAIGSSHFFGPPEDVVGERGLLMEALPNCPASFDTLSCDGTPSDMPGAASSSSLSGSSKLGIWKVSCCKAGAASCSCSYPYPLTGTESIWRSRGAETAPPSEAPYESVLKSGTAVLSPYVPPVSPCVYSVPYVW